MLVTNFIRFIRHSLIVKNDKNDVFVNRSGQDPDSGHSGVPRPRRVGVGAARSRRRRVAARALSAARRAARSGHTLIHSLHYLLPLNQQLHSFYASMHFRASPKVTSFIMTCTKSA